MTDTLDFDAWRNQLAANRQAETVRIFGQDVPVPHAVSLDLVMRVDDADVDDLDTLSELVAEMFGDAELQRWREAGCNTEEFAVLLAWGSARGRGEQLSFEEAHRRLTERAAGKAPNRTTRRAQGRKRRRS